MRRIVIANPKGGCGKTTLATQLAGALAVSGEKVVLIDHDPLKCCSDWWKARPKQRAEIALLENQETDFDSPSDTDWVVHDMPAAWSLISGKTQLRPDDRVLIPVLPSPNDIKACMRFTMQLARAGVLETGAQLGLVGNRTRANTHYLKVLLTFLDRLQLPMVTCLRDTQNYVRAMDAGLSIFDLPTYKVDRDLAQWAPLLRWLSAEIASAA